MSLNRKQQQIWYAIRRKLTGRLLPMPPVKQRGGQTHVSFESPSPPRLFPTKAGANVVMKLWLRGGMLEGPYEQTIYDPKTFMPIGPRKRKAGFGESRMHLEGDVEIVAVCIKLVEELAIQPVINLDEDDDI